MRTRRCRVLVAGGLHARPASRFVAAARSFKSDIFLRNVSRDIDFVDAKRPFDVLSAEVWEGDVIELESEGPDEAEAIERLVAIVEGREGERA